MILGFGSTEKETALRIIEECAEALKAEGVQGIKSTQAKYAEEGQHYKEMSREDAPERYSYFWAIHHAIYEGKHIVEFTMHHVHRRHALSPDGWALFVTRWILSIDPHDGKTIYCEA